MRIVITCTFDRTARIRCPPCIGCSKTLSNSDYNDADIDPRHLLPSIQRLKPRRLLGNSRSHGGGATADVESWNHIPISAGSVLPQDLRLALGARAFPPTREEGNLGVKAPTTTLLGPKRLWINIVNTLGTLQWDRSPKMNVERPGIRGQSQPNKPTTNNVYYGQSAFGGQGRQNHRNCCGLG